MSRDRTRLEAQLIEHIRANGPLTFRDYMETCLYDAWLGYYNTERQKIGAQGDFYTASNVHRVFGAVLASVFARMIVEIAPGHSQPVSIVEFGSGTGQLAEDILTTLDAEFPQVFERVKYIAVDRSPAMRSIQREQLCRFESKVEHRSSDELTELVGVVFSNELVDAMPVHRVRRRNFELEEQYIGLDSDSPDAGLGAYWEGSSEARFQEYIDKVTGQPREDAPQHFEGLPEGQVAEIALDAIDWLRDTATRIERGYLVTIDYGDRVNHLWDRARKGGTLRCFRNHRLIDSPLEAPGEQDMTSSVNFTALMEFGVEVGLQLISYQRQSAFLIDNGLLDRIAGVESLESRLAAKNLLVPGGASDNFRVLIQKKI